MTSLSINFAFFCVVKKLRQMAIHNFSTFLFTKHLDLVFMFQISKEGFC